MHTFGALDEDEDDDEYGAELREVADIRNQLESCSGGGGGGGLEASLQRCFGCHQPIEDRFLLRVMDRSWHERCLQCSVCRVQLSQSCFTRDRLLLCRQDYDKLYGIRCNGCLQPITSDDLVMRAAAPSVLGPGVLGGGVGGGGGGGGVYHARCFACVVCGHALRKGDQFVPYDSQIYCRVDFEKKCAATYMTCGQLSPRSSDWFNTKSDDDSSLDDDGDQTKGPKRPRTILTTSQRRKFKSSFEVNPKPCRKVRETLASETGLSVRVVQVWFQNQRAKVKKLARRQTEDGVKSDKNKKSNGKMGVNKHQRKEDDASDSSIHPSDSGLTVLATACSENKPLVSTDSQLTPFSNSNSQDTYTTLAMKSEPSIYSIGGGLNNNLISPGDHHDGVIEELHSSPSRPIGGLLVSHNHHHHHQLHHQHHISRDQFGMAGALAANAVLNPIDKLYSMQNSYFSTD